MNPPPKRWKSTFKRIEPKQRKNGITARDYTVFTHKMNL